MLVWEIIVNLQHCVAQALKSAGAGHKEKRLIQLGESTDMLLYDRADAAKQGV